MAEFPRSDPGRPHVGAVAFLMDHPGESQARQVAPGDRGWTPLPPNASARSSTCPERSPLLFNLFWSMVTTLCQHLKGERSSRGRCSRLVRFSLDQALPQWLNSFLVYRCICSVLHLYSSRKQLWKCCFWERNRNWRRKIKSSSLDSELVWLVICTQGPAGTPTPHTHQSGKGLTLSLWTVLQGWERQLAPEVKHILNYAE